MTRQNCTTPGSEEGALGDVVVSVRDLAKTFHIGFLRKSVEAVRGVSFEVRRGEVFGLIGPNGAGKTTTLKMLMGLVRPSRGHASIFGEPIPTLKSRARVGYLPEISYYYDYLKPAEILDFYGRLYGLSAAERRKRVPEMLSLVGLEGAQGKPLRKFSKGMLQRIGLAQALISDPDMVFLDEPQSGLDPIGRKEVADIILSLRERGKTVFFSSHILPDVERICDRVGVMIQGKIVDVGPLRALLDPRVLSTEIVVPTLEASQRSALKVLTPNLECLEHHDEVTLVLEDEAEVQAVLQRLVEWEVRVLSVHPRHESLEDVFVRAATGSNGPPPSSSP